jgi:hypothetical protein
MQISRTVSPILAALATAGAAALLLPAQTKAWNPLGGSLNIQEQRDVRVCANFTDSTVIDNTTPDPMFPGYFGVEMAIWKACVEWGSTLHGDGSGDPEQPGDLGSGGANFDLTWQGNSAHIGNPGDNVHSQLDGDGGGVYAYCETPIVNGWRIRYYQSPWIWDDGPGSLPGGRVDILGIAVHEYGHALGLGHSDVFGSTMFSGTSQSNSINLRTLHADDIAGVQGVYGVASSDKPRITGLVVVGSSIHITGQDFDPTGNEVWFTQAGVGGNGQPIKAFGVDSSLGGTFLSVVMPAGAGSGDVLVRRAGFDHDDLSNAWPFDADLLPDFETFCDGGDGALAACPCGNAGSPDTGCDNSAGTGGVGIEVTAFDGGGATAVLTCTGYPLAGAPTAIIMRSPAKEAGTPPVFGDGVRCVSTTSLVRLAAATAVGGSSVHAFNHGAMAGPGDFYYQAWYRNTGSFCTPDGFNLSSGVKLTWP